MYIHWKGRYMRLYVILDKELLDGKDPVEVAKELIDGGADLIQYRDKISSEDEIKKTSERLRNLNFPLVINDYPRIAKEVDASGVHLGQDDMDILSARSILGDKIIGRSTHNLKQALQAQGEGADYIGIGPVFPTNTKKGTAPVGVDVLKEIVKAVKIPAFAIGGITQYNIESILATGIHGAAIAGAILCSDNIKEAVSGFKGNSRG